MKSKLILVIFAGIMLFGETSCLVAVRERRPHPHHKVHIIVDNSQPSDSNQVVNSVTPDSSYLEKNNAATMEK